MITFRRKIHTKKKIRKVPAKNLTVLHQLKIH